MDRPTFVFSSGNPKRSKRKMILWGILCLLVIALVVIVICDQTSSKSEPTSAPVGTVSAALLPTPGITPTPAPDGGATVDPSAAPTAELSVTPGLTESVEVTKKPIPSTKPSYIPTTQSTNKPTASPNQQVAKDKYLSLLQEATGLEEIETINGFVNLRDLGVGFYDDIRYAGSNNIAGKPIYTADVCVATPEMAYRLVLAQKVLKKQGYGLKIWDSYRPVDAHEKLQSITTNDLHIAQGVSKHCQGAAVDVTLVNLKTGKEVKMPGDFDDFETGSREKKLSKEVQNNLDILTDAMTDAGFKTYRHEWWHFILEPTISAKNYDMKKVFGAWAE